MADSDGTVRSIMTANVVTLSPDMTVPAAADILSDNRIGAAPVVDSEGNVVGLLRDEDLLVTEANLHAPTAIEFLGAELIWPPTLHKFEAELKKAAAASVADVMTTEFDTVAPTASVEDAATLMHDKGLSHLPVVEAGKLAGIIARGDLIRYLAATT